MRTVIEVLAAIQPVVLAAGSIAVSTIATVHILLTKRDVRAAISWTGFVWFVPFVGALLYLLLGINRISRRAERLREGRRRAERRSGEHSLALLATAAEPPSATLPALRRAVGRVTGSVVLPGNRIEILEGGDRAFEAMLAAIDGARETIGLATYIFDNDPTGRRFVEALGRAVARGVEVRVLVDAVGSRYSKPPITGLLHRHGVPVALWLPLRVPVTMPYFNLRNHRKLLVVDGRTGFVGGMNLRHGALLGAQEESALHDVHFRVTGPVTGQLVDGFAEGWTFTTGEALDGRGWYPPLEAVGGVEARGIPDGPGSVLETLRFTLLAALAEARHAVRIVTPYFLPDAALASALEVTAMRGVRVDIVIPARSNLRLVEWATYPGLYELLRRGCHVWRSAPPFDHSKLMTVDGTWSLVGSANWDARSLRLNFEYNLEAYDAGFTAEVDALVAARLARSTPLTLADLRALPRWVRLRNSLAWLASPYL